MTQTEERSMISPDYARIFICDFIIAYGWLALAIGTKKQFSQSLTIKTKQS